VGPLLRHHLFEAVPATVLTSATLAAKGRFDYVRARLGIPDEDPAELAIGSPFAYERQALLYLPRDLPTPQEPGFLEAALARMVELCVITSGRAFLLFTSHRALRHAAAWLPSRLSHPLLVQGEASPPTLLETFRRRPGSVLAATSGFWEGVDVPGDALSLVVLEKLPFASPDDPLTAARARAVEEAGQDPFSAYQVPRAALALKQGFGRLIRHRNDRGVVAVLDHRILSRSYGQDFLASLPPVPRTSSLEQVRRWW
jgi:ATP-dependent DNA helicase DinG